MSAEEQSEEQNADEQERIYPFYQVRGDLGAGATVKAGYVTESGEVDYLVMDMANIGVGRVEQAFTLAFGWYCDELNAITGRARSQQEDVGDQEEDKAEDYGDK